MLRMSVELDEKLSQRAARRVINNQIWNIPKAESSRERPPAPIHVLGHFNSCKGTDVLKVDPAHNKIASAGKPMFFDIFLLRVSKHAFISRDGRKRRIRLAPDSDISTENRTLRRRCHCM